MTKENPLFKQLRPLETQVGVIIGKRSSDPWFNHVFEDEHDGKVSVKSAILKEDHELKVVNSEHTLLMENKKVTQFILNFLACGKFN